MPEALAKMELIARKEPLPDAGQIAFARSFLRSVLQAYWKNKNQDRLSDWKIKELPSSLEISELTPEENTEAENLGNYLSTRSVIEAGYFIGSLYAKLLPASFRSKYGVFYTPPCLVNRLLDLAEEAGANWEKGSILDPACGGGAFLGPLAQKIKDSLLTAGRSPAEIFQTIVRNLRGFEIDPFSAWISEVLTEITLLDICRKVNKRLPSLVDVKDSLNSPIERKYDLVIGNPPYGRITLNSDVREKFKASLYGHANLYALFTDLALRYLKKDGVLAYVTPTSFLSGQYFKNLRKLLHYTAPLHTVDFISSRDGVFDSVLQETLLAVFRKGAQYQETKVNLIDVIGTEALKVNKIGKAGKLNHPSAPWIIPRSPTQARIIKNLNGHFSNLAEYGYKASTGPLVWNRHKKGFRENSSEKTYPVIWAESVSGNGRFKFKAEKANHKPFFEPNEKESWLVRTSPCILVQRTTSKEQERRIIAAELSETFIKEHSGVIVENHLNMIIPENGFTTVPLKVVLHLLSSKIVDEIFRSINGSVAVSAYELSSIPLPPVASLDHLIKLINSESSGEEIEQEIQNLYAKHPTLS